MEMIFFLGDRANLGRWGFLQNQIRLNLKRLSLNKISKFGKYQLDQDILPLFQKMNRIYICLEWEIMDSLDLVKILMIKFLSLKKLSSMVRRR